MKYKVTSGLKDQAYLPHFFRTERPRNKGGLGKMDIPLLSDLTKQMSKDYGILIEEAGISLR